MTTTTFPPFSILIAPSYYHPMLRSSIMNQQQGCMGLRILSCNAYLASFTNGQQKDPIELSFQYREQISDIVDQLKTYASIALTPSFLMECHSFIETLKFYQITPDHLPSKTQAQQELKDMITRLYPIPTTQDDITLALSTIKDASNVYIFDTFSTLKELHIYQRLQELGATLLPLPEYTQQKEFYHAINPRQEIEAIAQYIIQHDMDADDIVLTLASSTYKPLVEQIFTRYNIPYTLLHKTKPSIVTQRFVNMISFALYQDEDSLFGCMDCGVFAHDLLDDLREYMEIFDCSIFSSFDHLQNVTCTGHILDEVEVCNLKELEIRAQQCRESILPIVTSMMEEDISILVQNLISLLRDSMKESTVEDISVLSDIQSILSSAYSYLHTKEDLEFLLPSIQEISISKSVREINGVIVKDLKQIIPNRSIHFLVGATQKNYPAFPSESGIFDENYLRETSLPSMETRYHSYMQQCDKLLHSNQTLIVSFPLGSYEGKSNEAALEIEEAMNCHPKPFPIVENYERIVKKETISSDTAKALFVKEQRIKGSISAIERYIHCPYSYFLRYGLSLREPMSYGFDNSYMGTLAHHVLETLVDKYGKQYTKATIERIEEIVETEVEAIKEVFPNNANLMQIVKQRFLVSITQTLKRLDDFETHSAMKPYLQEYEFHEEFPINDEVKFSLKGYIDRMDASGNFHCILDYKSSAKSLSEDSVFAALQLQLLTYAIVAKKQLQKPILGTYYISLKNQNIPYIAGKMKRRPVGYVESEKEEYEESILKAHRMNGWTMRKDIDMLDDNGSHIVGVSMNKDGIVKARKYYHYESIEAWFYEIYQKIGKRMLSGDIACDPDSDACTFCSYYEICRFKGFPSERKPLVETDDTLYWEGGNSDADME